MRCTQFNRPTKGRKKPTGKYCSLLPIVSDVAEESHKWTNTKWNIPRHETKGAAQETILNK